jgi:sec-independent protein translocase protein TatB
VLGPEKLPRVVSELGRWVGRARAMARQFREQLEEEVQLEEARKAQTAHAAPPPPAAAAAGEPVTSPPDTFSHAHASDATGADPAAGRSGALPSADDRGA